VGGELAAGAEHVGGSATSDAVLSLQIKIKTLLPLSSHNDGECARCEM